MAVDFKGGIKVIEGEHPPLYDVVSDAKPPSPVDQKHPPLFYLSTNDGFQPYEVVLDAKAKQQSPVEYHHLLSSNEIRFLLMKLKKATFTGEEMEILVIITMKLQEEYKKVLDKEQKNK